MSTTLRVSIATTCFAIVFVSGFVLSRQGKPPNTLLSTVHKLGALAAAVLIVMTIRRLNQVTPLTGLQLAATVVTGVLFASLAATGALLGSEKLMPSAVSLAHHIVPYLTLLSSAAAFYLLLAS